MLRAVMRIAAGLAAAVVACSAANAANLIRNGSFEDPVAPDGGFLIFSNGERIGRWRVIGAEGELGIINENYTTFGFTFPARTGKQWLDLTPRATVVPTEIGVEQSVSTTPGQEYVLTFFVGNVRTTGQGGKTSTVKVLVDDEEVMSATNRGGRGTTSIDWKRFSLNFTAAGAKTKIAFINGDSDDLNGLDQVTLVPAP